MTSEHHMVIAVPSVILAEGIITVITSQIGRVRFSRTATLEETEKVLIVGEHDLVIISPVLIQNNERQLQGIRKRFPGVPLLGLLHTLHDGALLSLLDDSLSINDTPRQIGLTIENILSASKPAHAPSPAEILSDRETEVLKLLAAGKAIKEIAELLNISPHTVITHRKNISQKIGIRSVSGLTIFAVVQKIIPLESLHY